MSESRSGKLVIIGLDCAEPTLVFERFRDKLPTLSSLADRGVCGPLRSCHPPITVPAWMAMMSSRDPGVLGVYGFRNRMDHSYTKLGIASSASVGEPLLWDYLSQAGKRVIVLGVPQTYPPRPVNGVMVSGFPTPSLESQWTYPTELKEEVLRQLGGSYLFDVPGFRTDDKARLRNDIFHMTEQRFSLARYLLAQKPWDFFMMVEMGTDRIHHGFWKFMDPQHPKYVAGNPWESVIEEYYVYVDQLIAGLLQDLPAETTVLVVSDHGAQAMVGGVCINEWLIQKGYLVLRGPRPEKLARLDELDVDWSRTRAWGEGGYYGRLFLNVEGREPQGVVPQSEYEAFRNQVAAELEAMVDPQGQPLDNRALKPENLYQKRNGVPPDLLVYFGNLHWRSVGTIGHPDIYTSENDTGPDDANHAQDGLFILCGPGTRSAGTVSGASLMDITPTVLTLMGVPVPDALQGQPIEQGLPAAGAAATEGQRDQSSTPDDPYSAEDKELLSEHLRSLGYID